jgi:ABC-type sulfate transport system permease component
MVDALREIPVSIPTDLVAGTALAFMKAEKALTEMVDFSRVNMRVRDSGIVVYEFVEIRNKDSDNVKTLGEMGV